ncbi:hypothetical protein [Actinomadura sp. NBRC 104425]|uniref:hypothetical protein n=1 Tax=Actinomadura sp. NBRC 104425 TaxID=3032204 RepID=UPI002554EB5F|nr:hypothetical protein [Actinomadura sp. NBRC 104425]
MQEVLIVTYCDRCYQDDQTKNDAAHTVEVSIGTDQARLDLCPRCDEELLAPLRELLRTRGPAQRALEKAAGNGAEQRPARVRPDVSVRCGECDTQIALRNRGSHSRASHGCDPQEIQWYFGDDVTEVWACSCGLAFPNEHGRTTHAHRVGHPLPEATGPQAPPRAA